MDYYHVIAKLDSEQSYRTIFADLNEWNLKRKFLTPYDQGQAFFVGHDLVSSKSIRSVRIICTKSPEEIVRKEIFRVDNELIDQLNRASSELLFGTVGAGYDPEDIAMGGEDITLQYIKGPPGHRERIFGLTSWMLTVASGLVVAGVAKWFDWV